MLGLFRRNIWFYTLLMLPLAVIMRFTGFLHPVAYPLEEASLFYRTFFSWLHGNPMAEQVVGIVVVFLQAVWINSIVIRYRLSPVTTLFSGVFYIILVSLRTEQLGLSPALIAGFAYLGVLQSVLRIYLVKQVAGELFDIGFGLAVAWLLYPAYMVMMLSVLPAILIMRSFRLKELFQWLGGVLVLFYLTGLGFSLWNLEGEFYSSLFRLNTKILSLLYHASYWDMAYAGFIVLLGIVMLVNRSMILRNIAFKERKKWSVLYWLFLLGLVSLFLSPILEWSQIDIVAVPLSMALGTMASKWKRNILLEMIFLLVLLGVLMAHSVAA